MKKQISLLLLVVCLTVVWAYRGQYRRANPRVGPRRNRNPKFYGLTFGGTSNSKAQSKGNWDSDILDQRVSRQGARNSASDRQGGASLNGGTWAWGGRRNRKNQASGSGAYDTWIGAARGKYDKDYEGRGERGGVWD